MAQSQARASARRDPVAVDAQHYRIEAENEAFRILRATYGPHEKSTMHGHPASVAIALADTRVRFTYPDGRTEEKEMKAGQPYIIPAGDHLPENLSDRKLEVLVIESKA